MFNNSSSSNNNNNNNNSNNNSNSNYPSMADLIMSRYRPIAPKPAPPVLLPAASAGSLAGGTTDPSSGTCAANSSLDSFTSSAGRCSKRLRKRRGGGSGGDSGMSTATKAPKLVAPAKSDAQLGGGGLVGAFPAGASSGGPGGASSSLSTQGNSMDHVVPLRDLMMSGSRSNPGAGGQYASSSSHRSSTQYYGMSGGGITLAETDAVMDVSDGGRVARGNSSSAEVFWGGATSSSGYGYGHGHGYGRLVTIPHPSDQQGLFLTPDLHHPQLYKKTFQSAPPQPQQPQQPQPQPPPPPHSAAVMQGMSPSPSGSGSGSGSGRNSSIMLQKDVAAFMERAAAANSSCGKSTSVTGGSGASAGGFTEMIRGITRLPTVADVQSLMQARSGVISGGGGGGGSGVQELSTSSSNWGPKRGVPPPVASTSWPLPPPPPPSAATEPEMELVTLPLLPNTPSKAESPDIHSAMYNSNKTSTASTHTNRHNHSSGATATATATPSGSATSSSSYNNPFILSTASGCSSTRPASIPHGTVIDRSYLDQVYGGSTDPVVLLEECHRAIWYNKAYDRALKTASQRSSSGSRKGPYIDPLGHPTPLGSFELPVCTGGQLEAQAVSEIRMGAGASASASSGGRAKTKQATLWGFLKKLVIQDQAGAGTGGGTAHHGGGGESLSSVDDDGVAESTKELCLRLGEVSGSTAPAAPDSMSKNGQPSAAAPDLCAKESCNSNAAVPPMMYIQVPRQLTTVTLERVTEIHTGPGPGEEGLEAVEAVEARLAEEKEPSFISDCGSRVRWMNGAFKQMLDDGSSTATPELTFLCCAEKMPRGVSAFSGCVNLEWMKGGRRRSMIVPCDVTMVRDKSMMEMWVWKFDMEVSLCLNLSPRCS